jgi:ribosomal protein L16 Arg81 hydroxylase
MDIADIFAPLSMSEFKAKIFDKTSVAITRKINPFKNLLTLEEIEQKLNDGCATLTNLGIIGENGRKMPLESIYDHANQVYWSPFALKKNLVLDKLIHQHSFVMHNMTQINGRIAELADAIETTFPGFHTDLHIYVSPKPSATSYNVHRDNPQHKIYLQLIGTSYWTIYKGKSDKTSMSLAEADEELEVDFRSELTPGSVMYMPPGTYHHVTNGGGSRVSLSFPFIHDPSRTRMDRVHIPFKEIFETPSVS